MPQTPSSLKISETDRVIGLFPAAAPEVWASLYPKAYANVGRWHSPRASSALMAATVVAARASPAMIVQDPVMGHSLLVARALARHRVPTFFVYPALLRSATHTDAPDNFVFSELLWPFPALRFMLPRGGVVSPVDGDLLDLCVTVMPKANDTAVVFASHSVSGMEFASLLRAPPTDTLSSMVDDSGTPHYCFDDAGGAHSLADNDAVFLRSLRDLTFRLMLMMQFCSEQVRGEQLLRAANTNPRKPTNALWSPNEFGRDYVLKTEAGATAEEALRTGRHPREHWRRGHWRKQPHGVGRQQVKRILIDPVYVGAGIRPPA